MSLHPIDWQTISLNGMKLFLSQIKPLLLRVTLFSSIEFVALVARTALTLIVAPTLSPNFSPISKKIEIDKTRTTGFHAQSNSGIERMNRTLLNVLAKCIDEDQKNWSVKLPYVLMAYRSSVHESTGFTPQYLVFGHAISLPLDLMYRPPPSTTQIDVHDWVVQKE